MDAKKGQYQEENGAAEAKYDLDDAYLHVLGSQAEKRAGSVACHPSRLEGKKILIKRRGEGVDSYPCASLDSARRKL